MQEHIKIQDIFKSLPEAVHARGASEKLVFWKVTSIGLAIGVASGALLAFAGVTEPFLHTPEISSYAASMVVMGVAGACFGINPYRLKNLFRRQPESKKTAPIEAVMQNLEKTPVSPIITVVYEGCPDYPASDTYDRDKLAFAKQALLNMDHTKAICN